MSKKTTNAKVTREVPAEHAERVQAAEAAALQAEAAVGRGLIELLGLAQGASRARQGVQVALSKAAISVGIDPEGGQRWNYDPVVRAFTKQEG